MKKKYIPPILSISAILGVFLIWSVLSYFNAVNPLFVPSPMKLWEAFTIILKEGYKGNPLILHILDSLFRLTAAFLLALVTAVPLGLLSGYSPSIRAIFEPFIEFYRPLPPLAYYTLLVLWLGIGDASKIALLYLGAFAPLYLSALSGVQKIPQHRIQAALSLGATKWRVFSHIIFPSSLPEIFTGIRTSLGFTYTTLVAAEMVAATSGLGWMVLDASKFLRSDIIIVGIFIMSILAISIDACVRLSEKKLLPWKGKE
ncbi:ABC transporter permease [Metabacillus fastidiosus]|uniref:ABC transporter permease subunit n=1 Tax=Metabacillus fastidiosus TaxID=1458 RepID=A0ABU6P3Y8_9BACI|nr:ABC transporter permease subunit [Metabacillus fastidiosus]MED4403996.1 ABC transporter permease subunit [Metabacillus fastidiosus]MED4454231.1 ABC transporter permease subunit [Metabacillus fastidiosus]MED4461077.1 ABC transporter permease subunit [Metabacillus fastidiosus]MED4534785.1 ABC transporter permease subunit [Metabacillus fastidiosus]